jgi:hypothetical protein
MCVLLRGLPPFPDGPSAVAVGVHGSAFAPQNLYVVAFNGDVTEIQGVADPGRPPKLRLQIVPPATVTGDRTRFTATVTANDFRVEGALVRLAGREALTGRRGHAKLTRKFKRPGRRRARVSRTGYRRDTASIRVTSP